MGSPPLVPYDYLDQAIRASCLIEPKDIDSFYNPDTMNHTGFAWDGTLYQNGVQVHGPVYASWFTESFGAYRGDSTTFPQAGLVLVSHVAVSILDETTSALTLWMQFLLQNNIRNPLASPPVLPGSYALADNWNSELNGWIPSGCVYADGVLSIVYSPDYGNRSGTSIVPSQVISYPTAYSITRDPGASGTISATNSTCQIEMTGRYGRLGVTWSGCQMPSLPVGATITSITPFVTLNSNVNNADTYGSIQIMVDPSNRPFVHNGTFVGLDISHNAPTPAQALQAWTGDITLDYTLFDTFDDTLSISAVGLLVNYTAPDFSVDSNMIVNIDFTQDRVYLDVAV